MGIHAPIRMHIKSSDPKGQPPRYMWDTKGRGIPRRQNIFKTRMMEDSHVIALPLSIITTQIGSTKWSIIPDEGFEDSEPHLKACEEIREFLAGHYNSNEDTFDTLQNAFARDMLSIGSGVIEKVLSGKGFIEALYPRDAGSFTKYQDDKGRLPKTGSSDPAYYQWAGIMAQVGFSNVRDSKYLADYAGESNPYQYTYSGAAPVEFKRNEIIWSDFNPRTWDIYGRGKVADAAVLAEIVLNMVLINRKEFSENEVPEGILAFKGTGQDAVQDIIDYWDSEVKGELHKMPILGAPEGIDWIPFRGSMKDLQYLESNQWYTKMVWMMFGLNANEVGDIAEVTRPGGTAQFSTDVWRKTTMPILSQMESTWNRHIIPFMEAYDKVGGNISFKYTISHPDAEDQMRERQRADLEYGLITINDVRAERGLESVKWGDMTQQVYNQMIATQNEWFYENFIKTNSMPEAPEPREPSGMFGLTAIQRDKTKSLKKSEPSDDLTELTEGNFNDDSVLFNAGEKLANETEKVIKNELKSFTNGLDNAWPKSFKAALPMSTIPTLLERIGLAPAIYDAITRSDKAVLSHQFEQDAEEIEQMIEDQTGERVTVDPVTPSDESHAMKILRERAKSASIKVEDDVRAQIETILNEAADGNWGIQRLTDTLDERTDIISHAKSRLIARTEIMQAQRGASQVFAESTDLISGKEWLSTQDNRAREWHKIMNGVIVGKTESFTVPKVSPEQGDDYPKETYIVGGDQPFNCRCHQKHVLSRDLPKDAKSLYKLFPQLHKKG